MTDVLPGACAAGGVPTAGTAGSGAPAAQTPECPWCKAACADAQSLALHMAQCGRRLPLPLPLPLPRPLAASLSSAERATASPCPAGPGLGPGPGPEQLYRYMRVLKQDPLDASSRTVSFVPLVADNKPFTCNLCGRVFASNAGLRKHARYTRGGRGGRGWDPQTLSLSCHAGSCW